MHKKDVKILKRAIDKLYSFSETLTCLDRLILLKVSKASIKEEEKYHYAERNIGFTINDFYDKWK